MNPTPAQLARLLSRGPFILRATMTEDHEYPPELSYLRPYETFSQINGGKRRAPADLLRDAAIFNWRRTYMSLSTLASVVGNDYDGSEAAGVRSATIGAMADMQDGGGAIATLADPIRNRIASHMAGRRETAVVAHEKAIYFVQALALLAGGDGPRVPDDAQLSLLLLVGSDYLNDWSAPDLGGLTELERAVADFLHVTRFNGREDPFASLARVAAMLRAPAPRGPLSHPGAWRNLQTDAFGVSLQRYLRTCLFPLFLTSAAWGRRDASGRHTPPIINARTWFQQTKLPQKSGFRFLCELAMTREEARSALRDNIGASGLPQNPTVFYRRPFVWVSDDEVVAASPWVVREYLRGGIWGRLLQAAKRTRMEAAWFGAFGDMFERWCRRVARAASREGAFSGRLIMSQRIGDNTEFEDIVLVDADRALICSVKARLYPEDFSRGANSRSKALRWLESFLFDHETRKGGSKFRVGALRSLHQKALQIRNGAVPKLARNVRVYPLVITFERMGENAILYKWIGKRCAEEVLLTAPGVQPPFLCTVDDFEGLMLLASRGVSPFEVLDAAAGAPDRRLSMAIYNAKAKSGGNGRLTMIKHLFEKERQAVKKALFQNKRTAPSGAGRSRP